MDEMSDHHIRQLIELMEGSVMEPFIGAVDRICKEERAKALNLRDRSHEYDLFSLSERLQWFKSRLKNELSRREELRKQEIRNAKF